MKIGIFTALFHDRPIEEALDVIAEAGIQAVELGAGAYPGSRHLDDVGGVEKLIEDEGARKSAAQDDRRPGPDAGLAVGAWQPAAPEPEDRRGAPSERL